jgi:LysM repeat protein
MRSCLILTLLIFTVFAPFHLQAQDVISKRSSVIENYKGKPYYIHFVIEGETLATLAKAYNVTVEDLKSENPSVEKGIKPDMVLRIPQKPVVETTEAEVVKTQIPKEPNIPAETGKGQAKPAEIQKEQPKAPVSQKEQIITSEKQDFIIYEVKKQETLYGISKQYNLTVDDILKANPGLTSLQKGMEIKIPKHKTENKPVKTEVPDAKAVKAEADIQEITVKTGETLYSIAKAHNTTVDNLIDLNPLLSGGLKAGMILKLHKSAPGDVINTAQKNVPDSAIKLIPESQPVFKGECYRAENISKEYQVALLLPFLLDDATNALEASADKNPSDFENFNYFQFYAGFMLAADSLEKYGLNAHIHVLDADKLNDTLVIRQALRKTGIDKMDLLVGPMYANSFTIAARFAQKHKIAIINPLSRRENIVEGNPFVIKAQASSSGVAVKLSAFIVGHYPDANIIAVRNDKKELKALVDDFSALIKKNTADQLFKGSYQESVFTADQMAGVTKRLKHDQKNIIIFFSNSKTNVPNFVSLLNGKAKMNDIILIGMDGWEEFDLETEFLVNLNFHQLTANYIDYESEAVQLFTARFRSKYGALPQANQHAFLGYDIGWYFLTSLMWYGDESLLCMPGHEGKGLQYNFNFSDVNTGDGLQNQDINIVKLQDYKMVKVE